MDPRRAGLVAAAALAAAVATTAYGGANATPSRLAFLALDGRGVESIAAVPAAGGRMRWLIPPTPAIDQPALSPDGRTLAFVDDHGSWLAPVHNIAAAVRFSRGHDRVAWSPDGAAVAYACARGGGLCIRTGRTGATRRILGGPAVSRPAWSRRGWLAVVRSVLAPQIWLVRTDGRGLHFLAAGREPVWSPDGTQLAFVNPNATAVLVTHVSGGKPTTVVPGTAGHDFESLAWSPDGAWLALNGAGEALYVGRPDGTEFRSIVDCGDPCGPVTWEPDSEHVLYDADFGETLHRVGLDGGNTIVARTSERGMPQASPDGTLLALADGSVSDLHGRLVLQTLEGGEASWSPDGKQIAWENLGDGIDIVDVATGKARGFVVDQGAGDTSKYHPSWAPNGLGIAYDESQEGNPGPVYLRAIDGSHQRALPLSLAAPIAWAPNGRSIAFVRVRHCGHTWCRDVAVAPFAAPGRLRLLVRNAIDPSWSPDGRRIAVTLVGSQKGVALVRADGGAPHVLAPGTHPTWID